MCRAVTTALSLTLTLAASSAGASAGEPPPAAGPERDLPGMQAPGVELARLVAPAEGSELVAGDTAWLEWQAGPGLASLPGIEEWEAFLSFDGGGTYPVRLTPHLDLGRSRIAFEVPSIPSDDVRLLLRFGDEKREWEQPVAGRFRIAAGPSWRLSQRRRVARPGEPARPGAPGVVLWAEGARDGSGWREVEAADLAASLAPGFGPRLPLIALAAGSEPRRQVAGRLDAGIRLTPRPAPAIRTASSAPASSLSLLLLVQRLNE